MAAQALKYTGSMALFSKRLLGLTKHTPLCRHLSSFKASDVIIKLTDNPMPKPDPDNLVFGKEFADHMLTIDHSAEHGWGKPVIQPFGDFHIHPAAKVFHYAVELFEGMKAYRGDDNRVRMFRPDCNMERMRSSALRSAFPDFDGDELIELLRKLISIDQEWVPYSTKSTLYIRPTMIATEPCLGVSKPLNTRLFVISGPVGPYYPTGFKPVSLVADPNFVRAWEGGCGRFKMGANYAPTIYAQIEALEKYGCQQVLWLYGPDHQVTEVGTMNFFMFWINEQGEEELVTPPLESGLILPGVTRRSCIDLAHQWGEFKMTQRDFTMKDIVKALKENRIKELFGVGTAAIVSPIDKIVYAGEDLEIPTMSEGAPITNRILKSLTDIQYGRVESDWAVVVD